MAGEAGQGEGPTNGRGGWSLPAFAVFSSRPTSDPMGGGGLHLGVTPVTN